MRFARVARRHRLAILGLSLASPTALLLVQACAGDSTGGVPAAFPDAGFGSDGGVTPIGSNDAGPGALDGSPTADAGPTADGAPADAATGDASSLPILKCTARVQLDVGPALPPITATQYRDKYLVTWQQSAAAAKDTVGHIKGRWFDGTTFQPEFDFGPGDSQFSVARADGTGKAFILHERAASMLGREVFDMTTGAVVSSSPIAFRASDTTASTLAALPQGAVAVYPSNATTEVLDRYTPGSGWSNGGDAGIDAGTFAATNAGFAGATFNAAGIGAAYWSVANGTGATRTLTVVPFDGTRFLTPITRLFGLPDGGGRGDYFTAVSLSNGDLAFAWQSIGTQGATLAIFHPLAAAGAEWGADEPIFTYAETSPGGPPLLLVDGSDTITALYDYAAGPPKLAAKRRNGPGDWTAQINIGETEGLPAGALDPAGNVVAVIQNNLQGSLVTRMPRGGTAFPKAVPNGLPNSNTPASVLFNPAGDPVIVAWGGTGPDVFVTTCGAGP